MRKLYIVILYCISFSFYGQIVDIPDPAFKNLLVNTNCAYIGNISTSVDVDSNNDGEIQVTEAIAVTDLNITGPISSIEGVHAFSNLDYLFVGADLLVELDVSSMVFLKRLSVGQADNLNSLAVSNCPVLTEIDFGDCANLASANISNLALLNRISAYRNGTNLSTVTMSNLDVITNLYFEDNHFTSLDVSNLASLLSLNCSKNDLQTLTLGSLQNLTELRCGDNQLQALDVSGLTNLQILVAYNNQLTTFDSSALTHFTFLSISDNQLTSVFLNPQLTGIYIRNNQLTQLASLPNLLSLNYIYCDHNLLTSLNFSSNSQLERVDCLYNQLTSLSFPNSPNLKTLVCSYNQLTSLNLPNQPVLSKLVVAYNQFTTLTVPKISGPDGLLDISGNLFTAVAFLPNSIIKRFLCDDTNLNALDLSNVRLGNYPDNPFRLEFHLANNPNLHHIILKNGYFENWVGTNSATIISNNPTLYGVCADANEVSTLQTVVGSDVTVTTNCALSTEQFTADEVALYPNPADDVLHIDNDNSAKIQSIMVYNLLGQMVKTFQTKLDLSIAIDVSMLKAGTYFLEIVSDQTKTTKKFLKK